MDRSVFFNLGERRRGSRTPHWTLNNHRRCFSNDHAPSLSFSLASSRPPCRGTVTRVARRCRCRHYGCRRRIHARRTRTRLFRRYIYYCVENTVLWMPSRVHAHACARTHTHSLARIAPLNTTSSPSVHLAVKSRRYLEDSQTHTTMRIPHKSAHPILLFLFCTMRLNRLILTLRVTLFERDTRQ